MTRRVRFAVGIALPLVLAIVLVALLINGSQGDEPRETAASTSTTTTTPATTSRPAPSSTLQLQGQTGEDPPALGRDVDAATGFKQLSAYRHWLAQHPKPELVRNIYDPRCPCYRELLQQQQAFQQNGWRWADEGPELLRLELAGRPDDDPATLLVVTRHGPQLVVDGSDKPVQRGKGWPPSAWRYTLTRAPSGQWRVLAINYVGRYGGSR